MIWKVFTLLAFLTLQISAQDYSLRFFGNGTNDIDRVKIPLDDPPRPVDVGDDLTLEFWIKANLSDNAGTADCSSTTGGDRWITGNTIFDRDIYGAGDYGDYGVSLGQGRIIFGVEAGAGSITLCGTSNVANGVWNHIAVTRRRSDGQMQIFVNGIRQAVGNGGTGDVSYRNNRPTQYPNSDPFLVIGAEKHDAGTDYPSFNGFLDEVRISNAVRYTANFTPPTMTFLTDPTTVALYHFSEGSGDLIGDVLNASHGTRRFGGTPQTGPLWSTEIPFTPTVANADLRGRLTRPDGQPLSNMTVQLQNRNNGAVFSTVTDADGRYQFGGLPTSFYYRVKPVSAYWKFTSAEHIFFHSAVRTDANFTAKRRRKW